MNVEASLTWIVTQNWHQNVCSEANFCQYEMLASGFSILSIQRKRYAVLNNGFSHPLYAVDLVISLFVAFKVIKYFFLRSNFFKAWQNDSFFHLYSSCRIGLVLHNFGLKKNSLCFQDLCSRKPEHKSVETKPLQSKENFQKELPLLDWMTF